MPSPSPSSFAARWFPSSTNASRRTAWIAEGVAGAAGALATLASVLTLGLIVFAALGPRAAATGIPAAFVATVIGGSLFALLARGPMPAGGPSSAPTLILAALVVQIVADPAFRPDHPKDIAGVLALCAAAVAVTGILQIGLALSGLTQAARYVPQPVLAGFMNGVAVLFVVAQIPALLGWTSGLWTTRGWPAFAEVAPANLAIGLITIAAILGWPSVLGWSRTPGFFRKLPAAFSGLACGCIVYAFVTLVWPDLRLGGLVGPVPRSWPSFDRLGPWLGGDAGDLLHRHRWAVMTTAALMALIGTLDIVLNGLALDQVTMTRTDPRRELLALGAGNLLSGVLGGLPLQLIRARALATWRAGGRTRIALMSGNLLFALLALLGMPLLALLPKVVLAGIMVVVGLMLFDAWSLRCAKAWLRDRRSSAARLDLVIVTIVCVASIAWSFAVGVAIGALLAAALFVRNMNRSLVRSHHDARAQPSRRIYADAHEAALQRLRASITILELEGALFFGSADGLVHDTDALGPTCRAVVMDLQRVGLIDASGAMVLSQIHFRLRTRGIALLLAGIGVDERHGRALVEFVGDALPTTAWYPDVDRAVEAAEVDALRTTTSDTIAAAVPLDRTSLMVGLDGAQCARLARCLVRQDLATGQRLFGQGDAGDRLYLLTEGSISILGDGGTEDHGDGGRPARTRFVTCSPGMMLGEVAMLDHRGRSAEAVADRDSVVHALSESALQSLCIDEPGLAALVYRNIAVHLSTRLRIASNVRVALQAGA